jgi:trk system potassium uptake protein
MNLSFKNPFRTPATDKRQFVVIGMGRFGRGVAQTLQESGHEVLGIDRSEKLVAEALADRVITHGLELDSTNPTALEEAGVFEMDTVIVAIGNEIQASIITTLNLKEGGVATVMAKASNTTHGKLLSKVGADRVVYPEHEMGCELARTLVRPGILDRFELDLEHSIVELRVPKAFEGKTIAELDLNRSHQLNLLAIGDGHRFEINPRSTHPLQAGQVMVVLGREVNLQPWLGNWAS